MKAELEAILVTDSLALAQARLSLTGPIVLERATPSGHILVSHTNPQTSRAPSRYEVTDLLRKRELKPETFQPRGGPTQEESESGSCKAKTLSGNPCKKDAIEGSQYCAVHQGYDEEE